MRPTAVIERRALNRQGRTSAESYKRQHGSDLLARSVRRALSNRAAGVAFRLVRDVPQDVVEALKRKAAEHGRSAAAEHRIILGEVLRAGRAGFWERAAALPEETRRRISVPSEELIRQDRDER